MNALTIDVEPDFPPHYVSFKGLEGLKRLSEAVRDGGCGATFFVCASLLEENPGVLDLLNGFEVGCHGLEHVDYTKLSGDEVDEHLVNSLDIFQNHGVKVLGFRAPYARVNEIVLSAVARYFKYDSSRNFWQSKPKNLKEFPLFTGGKMFGVNPVLFKTACKIPVKDKVFFTHPWEYGGFDFERIIAKRQKMRILGYCKDNYSKNLDWILGNGTKNLKSLL